MIRHKKTAFGEAVFRQKKLGGFICISQQDWALGTQIVGQDDDYVKHKLVNKQSSSVLNTEKHLNINFICTLSVV